MNTVQEPQLMYFRFEEDFMEDGIRCIPMIVRFKLDACGIKLKLAEWSRFNVTERECLATLPCYSPGDIARYRRYLEQCIQHRTGNQPTYLGTAADPLWAMLTQVPQCIFDRFIELGAAINVGQWQALTELQRFALLKLTRPGHENRNFPLAAREFGLLR